MKKGTIILVVLGFVTLLGVRAKNTYNNLVTLDEGVSGARANVENQYQRRTDLIPNLVQVVKGSADHEKSTLQAVVEARAKATSTNVNIDDAESMAQFEQNQGQLSSALSRLLVSVESYPDLKANENFRDLQVQLEGTENRITTERGRYNEAVKSYNTKTRLFPTNILARIFGFDNKKTFKAQEGAEKAPAVDFGTTE